MDNLSKKEQTNEFLDGQSFKEAPVERDVTESEAKRFSIEVYSRYEKRRNELGLSDAEVSRLSKVQQPDLSKWKQGKYMPKTLKLIAIARTLQISVEELVTGTAPKTDAANLSHGSIEHSYAPNGTDSPAYGLDNSGEFLHSNSSYDKSVENLSYKASGYSLPGNTPAKATSSSNGSQATEADTELNEIVSALKRMNPVNRNLVSALIAALSQ